MAVHNTLLTPIPGDSRPSSNCCGHKACQCYLDIHVDKCTHASPSFKKGEYYENKTECLCVAILININPKTYLQAIRHTFEN